MHRRQLLILHGVLAIAAALLVWRLVGEWKRANLRYRPPVQTGTAAVASPVAGPPSRPTVPTDEIVAKNLFSPDRTNELVEPVKAAPPPPVPIVFGTMNLGNRYEALMGEAGRTATRSFRRVKQGEQIGTYTVVEIRDEKVVIEYQGQKTTLDVYQSANSVPRPEVSPGPAASPVVESTGIAPSPAAAPPPAAPGQPPSASGAVQAPAADVRVTIEGNRRKFERQTPFGTQVWYENLPK